MKCITYTVPARPESPDREEHTPSKRMLMCGVDRVRFHKARLRDQGATSIKVVDA